MRSHMIAVAVLAVSLGAQAQTFSGKASKTPWGGYWWSMRNAELALGWADGEQREQFSESEANTFTECLKSTTKTCKKKIKNLIENQGASLSPMMKFDLWVKKLVDEKVSASNRSSRYTNATKNELKIHYISGPDHPHYSARGYAGKCTGWSMANMDYAEPTKEKVIDGILFKPADIKGYLAAIYNGGQFFVPDSMVLGNAYRAFGDGANEEYYKDPAPHKLLKALDKHIGKAKKIIVADMDPSDGVWNHPVYKYSVKMTTKTGTKRKGTMTLHYANDEVGIDDVFSTSRSRTDLLSRTLKFEVTVPSNWTGALSKIKSSRWIGRSADEHPDSLVLGLEKGWRNEIGQYRNSMMNTEVNFQLIKNVNIGNGWKPIIDVLLKKYYQNN